MTVCTHCFTDSAIVARQADMIEAREQQIAELKRALVGFDDIRAAIPAGMSMTLSEARAFSALLTHPRCSNAMLMHAMGSNAEDDKVVSVVICRLRKKLKGLGLEIRTIHGQGYEIPREQRDAAKSQAAA